jgi:hypothetical protein
VYSFQYILAKLIDNGLMSELSANEINNLTQGNPFYNTLIHDFDYGDGNLSPAFQKFLVKHIIPKLGYFETHQISELHKSEGMLHCSEYYAIKSVGNMDDIINQIIT